MPIDSIGGIPAAPITAPRPRKPQTVNDGNAADGAQSTSESSSSSAATTIVNTATLTNVDGSKSTITTYADGTTSTVTTAPVPKSGPGGVDGLLEPHNAGQGETLLTAQAQNIRPTSP